MVNVIGERRRMWLTVRRRLYHDVDEDFSMTPCDRDKLTNSSARVVPESGTEGLLWTSVPYVATNNVSQIYSHGVSISPHWLRFGSAIATIGYAPGAFLKFACRSPITNILLVCRWPCGGWWLKISTEHKAKQNATSDDFHTEVPLMNTLAFTKDSGSAEKANGSSLMLQGPFSKPPITSQLNLWALEAWSNLVNGQIGISQNSGSIFSLQRVRVVQPLHPHDAPPVPTSKKAAAGLVEMHDNFPRSSSWLKIKETVVLLLLDTRQQKQKGPLLLSPALDILKISPYSDRPLSLPSDLAI
ncbi:hypothetical protein PAAG_12065 [Paracoccidioides lutzii Pb01]|uniref:Uncharacterized protein n=1 Tax=Paracoccidioides lutzii (strain ATCC MYA-826 / Pb01) TaxID=502779 RepID=A0A0A2V4E9_PARBA|nr:hypothetical protein PAAG_12065 [Paracoccidioides lutzii Pb01]KGQ01207.1 hypothetical protein PAAG_12065 [Paracoccidioides lutzii Pb01]